MHVHRVLSREWDKKKHLSPDRNQTHALPLHRLDALTTGIRETRCEPGHILGSCMTCVLRIARIGNTDSVMR